jgi:hypothetical protein
VISTVRWIAYYLARLREPDPATAPDSAATDLANAFKSFRDPTDFIQALARQVEEESGGQVLLEPSDPSRFKRNPRGPAAFLNLTARKRLLVVPNPHAPAQFDD